MLLNANTRIFLSDDQQAGGGRMAVFSPRGTRIFADSGNASQVVSYTLNPAILSSSPSYRPRPMQLGADSIRYRVDKQSPDTWVRPSFSSSYTG